MTSIHIYEIDRFVNEFYTQRANILPPRSHTNSESKGKEERVMNCNANKCIACTVKQCAYHCETENYCSLDKIQVGTHEMDPTKKQCTDCQSFRLK